MARQKIAVCCLVVVTLCSVASIWKTGSDHHLSAVRRASSIDSTPGLQPLIAKHKGDVRAAILELAGRIERTDDGEVIELRFDYSGIQDEDFSHLVLFPELRSLSIGGTHVSDNALKHLAKLKKLESLALYYTGITEAGIEHLQQCHHLRVVNLFGSGVGIGGVKFLRDLQQLEVVVMPIAVTTEAQLAELKQLSQITTLDLSGSTITATQLQELRIALPNCAIYGP